MKTLSIISLAVAGIVIGTVKPASARNAPPFLQVGKSYSIIYGGDYQFTEIEGGLDQSGNATKKSNGMD